MARSPPAAVRLSGESKALKKVRALAFNVALHNSAGTTGRWTSARSTAANLRMVSTRARTVARALWSTAGHRKGRRSVPLVANTGSPASPRLRLRTAVNRRRVLS